MPARRRDWRESGNRRYLGPVRRDVNQYLKWAFVEAANVVCLNRKRWQDKYAVDQYEHVRSRRNHGKAIVAVARHLAESTEVDAQEEGAIP